VLVRSYGGGYGGQTWSPGQGAGGQGGFGYQGSGWQGGGGSGMGGQYFGQGANQQDYQSWSPGQTGFSGSQQTGRPSDYLGHEYGNRELDRAGEFNRGYGGGSGGQQYGGAYGQGGSQSFGRGGSEERWSGGSYGQQGYGQQGYGQQGYQGYQGQQGGESGQGFGRAWGQQQPGQAYGQSSGQHYGQSQGQQFGRGGGSMRGGYGGFEESYGGYGGYGAQSFGGGAEQGAMSTSRGRHTGRGPKGYQRSDDRIREDVCEILARHPDLDASEMEVRVEQGEVTLTGHVDSRWSKRQAEDAVESLSGVREVHNQLRVHQHGGSGGGIMNKIADAVTGAFGGGEHESRGSTGSLGSGSESRAATSRDAGSAAGNAAGSAARGKSGGGSTGSQTNA
jgi:osmotically-inducible protein OsmY